MKKYLFKITLFFALAFVIDAAVGKVLGYIVENAKGGENGRNNYFCDEIDADILVFGSSRASHHYNSMILIDSLGKSCYNCGQDGNGIILNYARYQLMCQRYRPKLVIYDVLPSFDLLVSDDNHKYLSWIKSKYDRKGIADVFESVDSTEKYKMLSQMYRYNSNYIQAIIDFLHPLQGDINGFIPIDKKMDTLKISNKKEAKRSFEFDSLKIAYLNKMLDESQETKFVFVFSPIWYGPDSTGQAQLKPVMDICQQRNIPFIDFSNDPKFVHNNEYFYDGVHLNARGADEFTRDLVKYLR